LTGNETQIRDRWRTRTNSWPVATVVCLLLMALLAVAQVAHLHSEQSAADHCPLCIAMHSSAPVTVATPAVVLVQVGTPTLQVEPRAVAHKPQASLFIRPPPAGC
jgi:hypothetical protein